MLSYLNAVSYFVIAVSRAFKVFVKYAPVVIFINILKTLLAALKNKLYHHIIQVRCSAFNMHWHILLRW
jgi:hypothetical protein